MKHTEAPNLAALREKLKRQKGKAFWRSLDELAESEAFQAWMRDEFPGSPFEWHGSFSRRSFLKLMGASMALAGLSACTRQPLEKIHPYVQAPEDLVPGKPLYFATAVTLGGYAKGVLVESHMGRPTKIEGNPQHPASLGATDVFSQAAILELYDPDRSQVVQRDGRIHTWGRFLQELKVELLNQQRVDGAGLRILTETVTSPTLAAQIQAILERFPLARWHQYEPVNRDHSRIASQQSFGRFLDTQYDFDKAEVIVAFDSDFVSDLPGSLRYARQFAAHRRIADHEVKMNRLYCVESYPTLTGTLSDHRLSLKPTDVGHLAHALARELGVAVPELPAPSEAAQKYAHWIRAVARDLKKHRGACLIVVGESQPPFVHMLAHILNATLENVGQTVWYTEPVEAAPVLQNESIRQLTEDMQNGSVELLVILGGNPAFNAPAELAFEEKLEQVKLSVHLSLYEDETSAACSWHVPQAHSLETWGDARAFDGTATIMQPLIAPLYGGRSVHEFLAVFLDQTGQSAYDAVRAFWQAQHTKVDFEEFWQVSVHDGVVAGTALPPLSVRPRTEPLAEQMQQDSRKSSGDGLEIVFRPDPTVWDGRFANNGWLQELPKPLTKLTWDNAAMLSPATAERLDLKSEDVVDIELDGRTVRAPVWVLPGHPDDALTVHFGYGRSRTGHVGTGTGFNAFALRTSAAAWHAAGAKLNQTGQRYRLASTQLHHNIDDLVEVAEAVERRHLIRSATLMDYLEHPELIHEMGHDPPDDLTLYPKYEYEGYSWGMVVDLGACIGCNACTVACQSENNIPVVGKDQVAAGREMHWIRVDRYYEGSLDNPDVHHQPVMCMHCENAPCEVVCPVAATTHSKEGLNEMVYNRCVGTRYCANNCPYKVRRFNFTLYADWETPSLKMMRNPDVTVRSRGVMEKCTYCVQRINHARIEAKKEDRTIRDGEILTACQQVCPTDAIVFGDINDPNSRVSQLKAEHRNYGILTELGTRPRTTYLAKIKNPNPEIGES